MGALLRHILQVGAIDHPVDVHDVGELVKVPLSHGVGEGHGLGVAVVGVDAGHVASTAHVAHVDAEEGPEYGGVAGGHQAHGHGVLAGVILCVPGHQGHARLDHLVAAAQERVFRPRGVLGVHIPRAPQLVHGGAQNAGLIHQLGADHVDDVEGQAQADVHVGAVPAQAGVHPPRLVVRHAPVRHVALVHGQHVLGKGLVQERIGDLPADLFRQILAGGIPEGDGVGVGGGLRAVSPPGHRGGEPGVGEGGAGAHAAGALAHRRLGDGGAVAVLEGLAGDIGGPGLVFVPVGLQGDDAVAGGQHVLGVQGGVHPQQGGVVGGLFVFPRHLQLEQVVHPLTGIDGVLVAGGEELADVHGHPKVSVSAHRHSLILIAGHQRLLGPAVGLEGKAHAAGRLYYNRQQILRISFLAANIAGSIITDGIKITQSNVPHPF